MNDAMASGEAWGGPIDGAPVCGNAAYTLVFGPSVPGLEWLQALHGYRWCELAPGRWVWRHVGSQPLAVKPPA